MSEDDSLYFDDLFEETSRPASSSSQEGMQVDMTPVAMPLNREETRLFPVVLGSTLRLKNCIMNASGVCSGNPMELQNLNNQWECGALVTKSSTLQPKKGRILFMVSKDKAPVNMQGGPLANMGLDQYLQMAVMRKAKPNLAPYIISVQGATPGEMLAQVRRILGFNKRRPVPLIDGIELNVGVALAGHDHAMGYDVGLMRGLFEILHKIPGIDSISVGLKLPAYLESTSIKRMACLIKEYNVITPNTIDFVTCIYSLANSLALDVKRDCPILPIDEGFGGLCGHSIKPIGLGNVALFRKYLGDEVGIVGVGGIFTGHDVYEYLLAGADAVQLGSFIQMHGIKKGFSAIQKSFINIMTQKGVKHPKEVRRRLRESPMQLPGIAPTL